MKKYTFTEIGLTVYGCVNCDGALFNEDPVKAYEGYHDSIISYDDNINGTSMWDIESLKTANSDAYYNKVKLWFSAGISVVSDFVFFAKITKAVKAGEGLIRVFTKDLIYGYVIPENIVKNPKDTAGLVNRYIAIADVAKAKNQGLTGRALSYIGSMTPILGSYDAVIKAIKYNYKYEYKNNDYVYSQGHDYMWYQD